MSKILQTFKLLRGHFANVSWLQLGTGTAAALGIGTVWFAGMTIERIRYRQIQLDIQKSRGSAKVDNLDKVTAVFFAGLGLTSARISIASARDVYQIIHSPRVNGISAATSIGLLTFLSYFSTVAAINMARLTYDTCYPPQPERDLVSKND